MSTPGDPPLYVLRIYVSSSQQEDGVVKAVDGITYEG